MSAEFSVEETAVRPEVRVVLECGSENWSAYAPSVPGCVATGRDCASVMQNITEALRFHLEGLHAVALREEAVAGFDAR